MANFLLAQLDQLPALPCPCGAARRAFAQPGTTAASVHLVEIQAEARPHYHRRLTEIYVVLEGEGELELDGHRVPVKPRTAVYLKPGCRHRAIGPLRLLNVVIPAFDPADEWFDDDPAQVGSGGATKKPAGRGPAG
jgi:mannose-6-phosphate isomerase-like protein (cupin superfamily)